MTGIYPLIGTVKHYDWGGFSFIPHLLKQDNSGRQPFAEYWLGTHILGMGKLENGELLKSLTGELSFLLKAQDVHQMLSIQVHPSKAEAEKDFARENEAGIPLQAPHRNYKDPNHKPEMLVAQSDFWLLHGFKPAEQLTDTLMNVAELQELLPYFTTGGYEALYRHIMEMPQEEVERILQPLLKNIPAIYDDRPPQRDEEDYWADRAARQFDASGKTDRGIFSVYLLNLVHLKKGEGLFQGAGLPHAYLEGQCVEIMANSDNVLRGGLTTKHIDIPELMKHVRFEPTYPRILSGERAAGGEERLYPAPVPDFRLGCFDIPAGGKASFTPAGPELLLLTAGRVRAKAGDTEMLLEPGRPSAIVFPGATVQLEADAHTLLFRASGM